MVTLLEPPTSVAMILIYRASVVISIGSTYDPEPSVAPIADAPDGVENVTPSFETSNVNVTAPDPVIVHCND
jgi:hypothetical protein